MKRRRSPMAVANLSDNSRLYLALFDHNAIQTAIPDVGASRVEEFNEQH
jgi:hypothetical protein